MRKNLLFSLLSLLFINTLTAQYLLPSNEIEQVGNGVGSVNNIKNNIHKSASVGLNSAAFLSLTYSSQSTSCASVSDGSIVGYATGGTLPYVYSITGISLPNNSTGIFNNLPSGSYTITVTDATLNTQSQNVVIANPINPLVVSSNATICAGGSTTLTVSGSNGSYAWVATPADPTLIAPNSPNPTVSPIVNTSYAVTSTVSTNKNLIFNGEFTFGNVGFTTDYQYLLSAPTGGIQKAYGIVANPNTWFSPFSNCTDHTTGTGKMMVIDGSTSNGGNDKFWSQIISTVANQNYTFSYWVQTVSTPNPATIAVKINGVLLGTNTAPAAAICGNWTQYTFNWNSGTSTSATIEMYDTNTQVAGNDFAIDDITFTTSTSCAFTKSVNISITNLVINVPSNQAVCNGTLFPVLNFTSNQPGTTFTWTNSNPLIPIGSSGTGNITNLLATNTTSSPIVSTITVTGSLSGCADNIKQFTITINPSPKVVVNNVEKCTGDLTPSVITATPSPPGIYSYAWTVPATVTNPGNNATINNATVAGNYSVVITNTTTGCVSESATGTLQYIINCCPNDINIPVPETLCDNASCTTLTASYIDVKATTSYTVASIPYAPLAPLGNTGTSLCNIDDAYSAPVVMPFKFSFYGNCYNIFQLSTNTYLTFNATNPNCVGSTSPWAFTAQIPALAQGIAAFKNSIFFPMQDTNPAVATPAATPVDIRYIVDGFAPCRKLIINVKNMPLFSCGTAQGLQQSQLVLYEGTNIIDIFVKKRSVCTNWNSGSGVIGIQSNDAVPLGIAAPGRNTGTWSVLGTAASQSEGWRFTPSGASLTSFKWLDASGATIGTTPSISVCPTATTTYTAQVKYTECNPTGAGTSIRTVTEPVTVEVYPDDTQNPSDIVNCSNNNLFNLTTNEAVVVGSLPVGSYDTPTYHTSLSDAQNSLNPIANPSSYSIPTGTSQTIFMSFPSTSNICLRVKSFNVILNPCIVCPTITTPSTSQTLCVSGNPTPFSVSTSATGNNAISYVYFTTPQTGSNMYNGGIPLGLSTPNAGGFATLDLPVLGSGSLPNTPGIYYVYAIANPAPSDISCRPYELIQVTVNAAPALPTVTSPVTYCQGATATALSAVGTGLLWYTVATGGTGSTTAIIPSTASAGTTIYYVSQTVSGCEGPRAPISVIVNATPVLPTVTTPVTYCQGATASALSATGTGLLWYGTPFGGTGTATVPIPSTTTSGTFTYYVSQTILGCEGPRESIAVTVNATPALPTVTTPVTYCQGATTTSLTATGTGLLWYAAATGGTGSVTIPTPSSATAGVSNYYVSQTILGCEGPRETIVVTVNAIPSIPAVTTPITYCQGVTASALNAVGTGLLWYTSATGGTGSTTAIIPSTATSGTTLYYVSQTILGCEGPRESISVTVNATPALPIVTSPVTYCQNDTAAALIATGTGLLWYTTPTGGTGSATVPTPSTATAGVTTYYVSQTILGCEGPRESIAVTVNATPALPIVASVTYCQNDTATVLTATGTGLLWYTAATGGTGSATAPIPSTATAGVTAYYVSQTILGCEGPRASLDVTVNATPSLPTVTTLVTYCQGATATALSAVGTGLLWYTTPTGGTGSATAPTPSTATAGTTLYYVSQTISGCEGPISPISVTVNATPALPTVTSPVTYCQNDTAVALSATGTGLLWYTTPTGGTGSATVPTPSTATAGTTTYYVSQTILGCEGPREAIAVTVNATPALPIVAPVTYCQGATASALTATGAGLLWYTAATGGSGSATAPTPSTATAGVTTYYVSQTILGCEGPRAAIDVTVLNAPAISTPTNYEVCDDNADGVACSFNLQTKDIELTAAPGLTITYHLTPTDAQTGDNPIPNGPYCNITNPQIIYPRVYNPAAPACVSTSSFQLIVNPKPQVNLSVTDYQLCDDNNSPDGVEQFDLSTKDAEIINGQPSMVVTYYLNQADATAQTSALPSLYTNVVVNVQTIWFNIKNTVTGCSSVGSFKLVVNPLPIITVNSPTVCQGNAATVIATAATAGVYSFVWTVPLGATNPGDIATFTTTTPGVYSVIATNTLTGCVGLSASGTVSFITAPSYSVPTTYEVCDDNNDGVSCLFVLNTKDVEISTQPGVVISYHLTPTDAQTGANPIPSATPYCNIVNPQTIYPRIFNPAAPTCASTTSFQLVVNPKPAANLPSVYHICDDNTDGLQVFNLSAVVTPQVLGTNLPSADYTVSYYTSLANAQAGTPIINPASAFVTATTTVWIRVENNLTGCYAIITVSLVVDPLPTALSFYPQYELCETVAPLCVETFDLNSQVPSILQGQLGTQVTFYPSLLDATNNTNAIVNPSAYDNAIPCVQTLGIRITNVSTGCFVISTMDLVVNPKPQPIPPTGPYTLCGTDQSGLTCFDLTTNLTPNILFQSPGVYTITYHLTAADATNNLNAVNANWYCVINPFSQFLWVRAENPITHCFSIMQIELNVDPAPIMPFNLTTIANCDTDSNTQNGCTTFNLETQTPIILAAQVTPAANYTVTYFTTQAAASATPAGLSIFNTTSYTACGTTTIWVRVENINTNCFSVGSFQLQVNTPIVLTTPTLYSLCDYAQPTSPSNDQYAIFDMLGFVGAVPGHTLEFFLDAAHTQLISNPSAFQNSTNAAQTVFIVATNTATGCKSYRTLTIQVLPIPTPRTDLTNLPLVKCDDVNPNDGYEIFNLTTNATYIMNGDVNVSLHYFPTYNDAVNNTSEILNPTAANVNQNVWIRVESLYNIDTQSPPQHCYVLVEQPIVVNPAPLIVPGVVYQECDDDTDGFTVFNLNSQASILLNGNALPLSNYTMAFYLDAALTQPISSTFTNTNTTGNTQVIYVVATNTVTGCKSPVSQFTIMVNPKPILITPPNFATCDDEANDNDGYYLYPLDVLIPNILGATQTLADYDVTFYDTQYNPFINPPLLPTAISNLTTYQAYTHTVWVAVKNKITGCERIASFNLIVEQLPQPVIAAPTNVICVDYNTQQVVRDLVLTATNATTYLGSVPTYTYQWYDAAGVAIPGATGATYTVSSPFADNTSTNYSVTMTSTSPQGCTDDSPQFTVLQSGQAVPFPAGSQGYTITNAFSENQTITVDVIGYGTYEYSLDDGPRQSSNVFEYVTVGSHYVTVWDTEAGVANSCDPLVITNIATIDYPHYFTPNGDGIHDYWNIRGLENDFTAKIYIFDRYGKLIKQISPQGQGWDGTFNGSLLPSTDYWFTVDYTEAAAYKQFKAHFTLKR